MKGPDLAWLSPAPLFVLASACASPSHLPRMPAWSPEAVRPVVAAAPRDIDDDEMRVPRDEEPREIWPAKGLYLGGALITSQPMGDFDGDFALLGPTDVLLVPDIDVGAGGGIYLSQRWHMNEILWDPLESTCRHASLSIL